MANLFLDEYEHCDTRIMYSSQNIPGPGADLDSFNCQIALKCACSAKCSEGCACLVDSGVNYDSCGRLLGEKFSMNSAGVIECGTECNCGETCGNRVVQRGPVSGLEVVAVGGKGLGLMRNQDLRRGDFICEYAGEVIGKSEAKMRANKSGTDAMNYIFVLEEHSGQNVVETFVDPTCIGNIGRYINHSCNPNAAIVPVRFDSLEPHLAIFALTDIGSGCEITYSYSQGEHSYGKIPCLCAEDNCNKFIPFNPNLF
ncbi:histone-lysine N-methyltransferase SETMAR [Nilaparvata lugens]|uniref:histone-lysine N-methyltransferase SETMAR n=1 Tax=Nilaparvata lugens TaxID=108931 RepID=UPI00193C891D|nr:histone-lysine N-methyltransferase SETMAR [Nilaparvata lugens]